TLRASLSGTPQRYQFDSHPFNIPGTVKGRLVGGNLALLAHLCGTKSFPSTKNAILFLEDVGEYTYNVDRMLYQLKRSGAFKKVAGVIIGGFTDSKDTDRPFGKTMDEIINEVISDMGVPVCFNFPVSHGLENVALKIGANYKLTISGQHSILKELQP
ncbi:MAG: LD-carboxypeptidase, partial [Ferruginibacter sp.]